MNFRPRRLLLFAVLLGGCAQSEKLFRPWPTLPTSGSPQVQHRGGGTLLTTQTNQPSAENFLARVNEYLLANQAERAERYIACHPDLALEALRGANVAQASLSAMQLTGRVYDRMAVMEGTSGWTSLLADRVANPQKYVNYDQARSQILTALKQGQLAQAVGVSLVTHVPKSAPNALLAIDAAQLTSTIAILNDKPKLAVAQLSAIREKIAPYPHQAAYVLLMLSDAQRRLGKGGEADAEWERAVGYAGRLLQTGRVADPVLWDRCAYFRPAKANWPSEVRGHLLEYTRLPGRASGSGDIVAVSGTATAEFASAAESYVWACAAQARLKRGETELALAAYKQAEAWASEEPVRQQLQLAQAEVFLELQQTGPAVAVLTKLAAGPPTTAAPALALLGALRLQQKAVKEALPLLRKAVEEHASLDWPGRAQAEANLGLALLLSGDEARGRQWLHQAQKRFETAGQTEQLRQSLTNEMNYLVKQNKPELAKPIRDRLDALGR